MESSMPDWPLPLAPTKPMTDDPTLPPGYVRIGFTKDAVDAPLGECGGDPGVGLRWHLLLEVDEVGVGLCQQRDQLRLRHLERSGEDAGNLRCSGAGQGRVGGHS